MKIEIQGMHCQACVRRVEKALAAVNGTRVDKVEIGSAEIEAPDAEGALAAIRKAGYEAQPARN